MAIRFGRPAWASNTPNEPPKSPWGGGGNGGGGDDSSGGGKNGGGSGDGKGGSGGGGPRNPWSLPPGGPRRGPGGPGGAFDDLFRRARRGSGFPSGLPFGPQLWFLVAGALVLLWIGVTSVHSIGPQQRGVVTTLGRYTGTLEPGWRFTLPAPVTDVEVINVQGVRTENFPGNSTGENLMITGDQNIVDLAFQVQWDIQNAADFAYQIKNPTETVRAVAETAMRAAVARASLNDTIGSGRTRIEAEVQLQMQQILDEYNSGIHIISVSIKNASAPQAVDDAFKDVTAAQQDAQGLKNNANAYAQQVIAQAQGDAAEFDKIYEQYKLAPEVTRRRLYYETMESILARTDKVVVETPGVAPYLPLPAIKRREPEPDIEVQGKRPGATK